MHVVVNAAILPLIGLGIGVGSILLTTAHAFAEQVAIYRCAGDGGVVYTDRPCAGGADPHEIDDSRVSVYTPAPGAGRAAAATPSNPSKAKPAKPSKPGRAADPDRHRAKCAKLDQGLRDVRTKMRSGYGAKEGERLKTRQRQLNEQRRTQKCR